MNIFRAFEARVGQALGRLAEGGKIPAGLDASRVLVEPPRDAAHGDLATNAALVLAKEGRMNPRALAELLAGELGSDADIASAEVAGPGFLNLKLRPGVYQAVMRAVLTQGKAFGRGDAEHERAVNVEVVSANPPGPMHVGHGRGAVFGDALANLLAFAGHRVAREYYINDAGAQVDVLARSAYLRYREALGETIAIPEGLYPGDYLKPVGAALAAEHGGALNQMPEDGWLPIVRAKAIAMMMETIREDLAALNVVHDVFYSERSLVESGDAVRATIETLRAE